MPAIYMNDSYVKEFETTVKSVNDNKFIVLENTAFYPNSGGQPFDTGKLIINKGKEYNVIFVGKFSGNISHEVDKSGIKTGDKVKGIIDWERRYKLMKSHTASHIISSVFEKEAGAKITGNQLGFDKSRIDYNLKDFDKNCIIDYIKKANDIAKKNMPIKISYMKRGDALSDPCLLKLANVLPPSVDILRIVEIEGIDKQVDGGTHVKNTSEIGTIKFLKAENKGKNNRRVYFELI